MSGGLHLAHRMSNRKITNMLIDTKPKQENKPNGTSAVNDDEYENQVMLCKENVKIQIERKRNVSKGNQKLYTILIDQSLPLMRSKLEVTTGHEQVEADQDGITLLAMIKNIVCGVEESLQNTMSIVIVNKTLHMFWKNPTWQTITTRASLTPTSLFWSHLQVGLTHYRIWRMVRSESCTHHSVNQRMRY